MEQSTWVTELKWSKPFGEPDEQQSRFIVLVCWTKVFFETFAETMCNYLCGILWFSPFFIIIANFMLKDVTKHPIRSIKLLDIYIFFLFHLAPPTPLFTRDHWALSWGTYTLGLPSLVVTPLCLAGVMTRRFRQWQSCVPIGFEAGDRGQKSSCAPLHSLSKCPPLPRVSQGILHFHAW